MSSAPVKSFDQTANVRLAEANNPSSKVLRLPASEPLRLDCDQLLAPISIAYQTYGALNAAKSNAILVCHALTGDQHVASEHPVTGKPGWWDDAGRPRQADRHQPLLRHLPQRARRLHGLDRARHRSTRTPASPTASTSRSSPSATWCDAQVRLIDHLGIDQLFCVIGGSMGGMQVLQWAASHSERVFSAVPIATAARHSSQNIAFHEVGRQAVMADPDWRGGDYYALGKVPRKGPRGRAHGRAHHLPVRGGPAPQVRPQPAGAPRPDLRLRRRLPGGELPAPPGLDLRRPLRRQLLSLHHPRDGLFRPRRPSTAACWPTPSAGAQDALLRGLVHHRLALSDAREPRASCTRSTPRGPCQLRRDRDRQGPRRLPARRAGVLRHHPRLPERGRREARAEGASAMPDVNLARDPDARTASTICSSPRWSSRARACSTSAAATARCCSCWPRRKSTSTGAAWSCRASASTPA